MEKIYLVTGASSGIGHALVQELAKRGKQVIAGVFNEAERPLVSNLGDRVWPRVLDVTNKDHIQSISDLIRDLGKGPIVLVNNAGVAAGACLELDSFEVTRQVFEINYFGPLLLTKTLIPLMRERGGRIVNVSSLSGVIGFPFMSAYSASKFALEGASDSLRRELKPFGIDVVVVRPGIIATPIWQKGLRFLDKRIPSADSPYMTYFRGFYRLVQLSEAYAVPVAWATKVLLQALEARSPKARYVAGQGVGFQIGLYKVLPTKAFDFLIGLLYKKLSRTYKSHLG